MYRPLAALALLWMAPHGCDYDAPLSDRYAPSNTIAGTLVTDGVEVPGDTIVLLFDAKNPPPPIGLGRPITFTTVPAADYTTDGAGVKSAPYAIPYLPDTSEENGYEAGFLVTALIDTDSNFNPFAPAIAGSTCGDWLGEHRSDIGAPLPAPVFVSGGELLDGVTVVIDREQPTQRPAFTLKEGPTRIDLQQAVESGVDPFSKTQLYRIESTSVHTAYGTPPADYNLPGPCASVDTDP